jgi:hypothetical protein
MAQIEIFEAEAALPYALDLVEGADQILVGFPGYHTGAVDPPLWMLNVAGQDFGSFKAHRLILGADEHTYWGPAQEMRGIRTAVSLLEQVTAELDVAPARVACIGTSNAAVLAALTGLAFGAGVLILGGPPLAMGTLLSGWATVERREGGKPMVSASHLLELARRDGGPDPVDWLNGLLPSLAAACPRPCRVRLFASSHDFVFPGCLEFFQQRELWPNVDVELDLSEAETHDASAKEFYDKFLVRAVREELVMTADPV